MIELIDHMGNDLTIVNSARVSFNKHKEDFDNSDKRLIKYLIKHNHWTPFSHPMVTFRIKMPIFIARQWFKHMVGITRNEVSRRYVSDDPGYFLPGEFRKIAKDKKQGSSDKVSEQSPQLREECKKLFKQCDRTYKMILACGIAPEQARIVLPQATLTEFYETGSLAAYMRLLSLRLDENAQKEIREYATQIAIKLKELFPVTFKVWEELNAEENEST